MLCALSAAAALTLCGCSGVLSPDYFSTEYVVEATWEPVLSAGQSAPSDATVRTLDALKEELRRMVAAGESRRRIAFDSAYDGDASADMASACWQIRTQDALCAYCVENIAYDVSKIVNHYEATVSITYSEAADDLESIVKLPYAADAGETLRQAMTDGQRTLVILSEHSSYSAEDMANLAVQTYRSAPAIAPQEPAVTVDMISGEGTQRLYVLTFDYGLRDIDLAARQVALLLLKPFAGASADTLGELDRALLACRYLASHCRYVESADKNSVYAALIEQEANSAGMAYAYAALCRELGLDCLIVDGEYNRVDHSWNLVSIEGDYYHVDPSVCASLGLEAGFLLNDETAWGPYRWDYFEYPHGTGTLTYREADERAALAEPPEPDEENPDEENI